MGKKFKFIHTADLHLGSILHIGKKANNSLTDVFNNAVYYAFEKICDIAIEQKVNFVLISGDIYDREARSVKGNSFFIEQCKRLKEENIMVYAIGGNHDPIKANSELFTLPENVHILSSDKAEIKVLNSDNDNVYVRIVGQSYKENWDSRRMHIDYDVPRDGAFNIALLHTQLDNNNNYIPCSVSDLKALENIDYWALGHIHKCRVINELEPMIAYPGIPQGRDFGEEGIGGALLVEIENNIVESVRFIPTSQVIWKKIAINIDDAEHFELRNISDLEALMLDKSEQILNAKECLPEGLQSLYEDYRNIIRGYVIEWDITGRGEIYSLINDRIDETVEYLIESINSKLLYKNIFLYSNSIELNIRKPMENLENLKKQNSSIKEISRFSKLCLNDEDIKEQLVKRLGGIWEKTDSYEDINIKKLQLDNELLEAIIYQAEQLAIDAIIERSEEM